MRVTCRSSRLIQVLLTHPVRDALWGLIGEGGSQRSGATVPALECQVSRRSRGLGRRIPIALDAGVSTLMKRWLIPPYLKGTRHSQLPWSSLRKSYARCEDWIRV